MTYIKNFVIAILSIVVFVLVLARSNVATSVGGNINLLQNTFLSGVKVGPSEQLLTNMVFGSCNLAGSSAIGPSNSSTSTRELSCTATGVKSGDYVMVRAPATQAVGLSILGATASTTDGYIRVVLANASSTQTIPATATTSIQWMAIR